MPDFVRRRRLLAGVACFLSLPGCLGNVGGAVGTDATAPPAGTPGDGSSTPLAGLDAALAGLVTAEDRAAYAETHGLDYQDGRVTVVVELGPGDRLPSSVDFSVTRRRDRFVVGDVSVEDLPSLATAENVTLVRPPTAPSADGTTE